MTEIEKDILSIIRGALKNEPFTLPDTFDFQKAFHFGIEQQVLGLLCCGLMKVDGFSQTDIGKKFFNTTYIYAAVGENQMQEVQVLFDEFEANGVDYIPLKGVLLKKLFPSPEMRIMGDIDVLIKPEEYTEIRKLMLSLGYVEELVTDYEFIWTKGQVQVELHKELFPNRDEKYMYYNDVWDKVIRISNHRYEMTPEDNIIYLFSHFAKHYARKGTGIRFIFDFYVFNKHYPDMDSEYIKNELEKLNLYKFYLNISRLAEVWLEKAETNDITDFITSKLFASSIYGNESIGVLRDALRYSKKHNFVRVKRIFEILFPKFRIMVPKYPILKRFPVLLPVMWIFHWFKVLIRRRDSIAVQLEALKNMSDDSLSQIQDEMKFVGLE